MRSSASEAKEAAPRGSGPRTLLAPRDFRLTAGRDASSDVDDALLGLRLGRGRRLRGKLEHGRLLTFQQLGQQDRLPVGKLERIVMHPRLIPVELPKDRRLVADRSCAPAEEAGCGAGRLLREGELRSRKHANRRRHVLGRGESSCPGTEVARRELVADFGGTRFHIVQAVVAHGEDSSSASPPRRSTALLKARKMPFLWRARSRNPDGRSAAAQPALASATSSSAAIPSAAHSPAPPYCRAGDGWCASIRAHEESFPRGTRRSCRDRCGGRARTDWPRSPA